MYSVRAQPHQNPVAPDFRIPAMLSNENAPDFRPLPPEAGNGRKSGAFSLESIAGIRKSGATGFWCGCALIVTFTQVKNVSTFYISACQMSRAPQPTAAIIPYVLAY